MGATPEGKKELIAVADGHRESEQSWYTLLLDCMQRRLMNASSTKFDNTSVHAERGGNDMERQGSTARHCHDVDRLPNGIGVVLQRHRTWYLASYVIPVMFLMAALSDALQWIGAVPAGIKSALDNCSLLLLFSLGAILITVEYKRRYLEFRGCEDELRRNAADRGSARIVIIGEAGELLRAKSIDSSVRPPMIADSNSLLASIELQFWVACCYAVSLLVLKTILRPSYVYAALCLFLLCVILIELISKRFGRSYYRVIPGELHVIQAPWLATHTVLKSVLKLDDARIIVNYPESTLEIYTVQHPHVPANFALHGIRNKYGFIDAVLAAALSEVDTPKLPTDKFLG